MKGNTDKAFDIYKEILRKMFHIGIGVTLLLFYIYFGRFYSIVLFTLLLGLAILSDIIRIRIYIHYPLKRIAETIARSYEKTYVGAHTYSIAGFLVTIILFENIPFLLAALTLTIIDPVISLAGLLMPRYEIPYNKSKNILGTLIGCFIAFIISSQFITVFYSAILVLIIFGIDSLPIGVNDNILYPFVIGLYVSIINGPALLFA